MKIIGQVGQVQNVHYNEPCMVIGKKLPTEDGEKAFNGIKIFSVWPATSMGDRSN